MSNVKDCRCSEPFSAAHCLPLSIVSLGVQGVLNSLILVVPSEARAGTLGQPVSQLVNQSAVAIRGTNANFLGSSWNGFRCPKCGHPKAWPVLLLCAACGRQTSVAAGTIFQDTRTPLTTWFRAIGWVTSQKTGASGTGLQHVSGGSYETAWTRLQKLRRAMVRPGAVDGPGSPAGSG